METMKSKFSINPEIWYSRSETAQAIGCGKTSIDRWAQRGKLRVSRIDGPGSRVLISGRSILEMLGAE